jgi:hypothetical protein
VAVPTSGIPLGTIDMSQNTGAFTGTIGAGLQSGTDTFTFVLSQPIVDFVGSVITFRNANRDIDFTSIALSGGFGTANFTQTVGDGPSFSVPESWGLNLPALAAGSYSLALAYNKSGSASASYAGTLEVTPVPEPETYAMMLAGLSAVGFMARRRRQQV